MLMNFDVIINSFYWDVESCLIIKLMFLFEIVLNYYALSFRGSLGIDMIAYTSFYLIPSLEKMVEGVPCS